MKATFVRLALAASTLAATHLPAATLVTRFDTDPLAAGWQACGNTNLFAWDAANQNLRVTWDSSQSNSYFARPLGRTLSRTNDFLVSFDLRLNDIAFGTTPGKASTFQIAVSLLNLAQATDSGFIRGSGYQSPNLVDWDYFPDPGWGAGISTPMVSSTTNWVYSWTTFELATNVSYRVQMIYTAADQTLRTTMTSNGVPVGMFQPGVISGGFGDFALDAFAVSSYSDEGQDPDYGGSVLAHGTVDNVAIAAPLPAGVITMPAPGQAAFVSDTNWNYTLEGTTDFATWSAAAPAAPGNGGTLVLEAANAPAGAAFYRVRATLP